MSKYFKSKVPSSQRRVFWLKTAVLAGVLFFFWIQPLFAEQVDASRLRGHSGWGNGVGQVGSAGNETVVDFSDLGTHTGNKLLGCGDANNDNNLTEDDAVFLFNYCFKNGTAPPNLADADCDGYSSITVRDIAYLVNYLSGDGPPPNCVLGGPYVPVLEPADTITVSTDVLLAFESMVVVRLDYKNSDSISALALPLKVTIGGSIPQIDSVVFESHMSDIFFEQAATIDPSLGTVNVGLVSFSGGLAAGSRTMLSLYLSIAPEPFNREIKVDPVQLAPSNYPLFIKPTTLDGVIPEYVYARRCGDANVDNRVTVSDVVFLFNYCFKNGAAPPYPADADCDGYSSITVRDIDYLVNYLFLGGPYPNCILGGPYIPVLEPADIITVSPNILLALDGMVVVTLDYKNSETIEALALPLKVTVGGNIPQIDSVVIGSRMSVLPLQAATIDPSLGTVNVGFASAGQYLFQELAPGDGDMLSLYLSIAPEPFDREIKVDPVQLAPSNYPLFIKPTTLDGVIPGYVYAMLHRNDTLSYSAYSPVDLIVTDPNGDSIGISFNTIPNATYDTTQDKNGDGDKDDIVTIPNPLLGDYTIRVKAEPGVDSGHYTLAVKLDGNKDKIIAAAASVPPPGQDTTFLYPVTSYLRGDPNRDGKKNVTDVIFLINYLFKGGYAPVPLFLGDVNCKDGVNVADVIYLVNYLFKGGEPPCS